jgi:hypothetical protein
MHRLFTPARAVLLALFMIVIVGCEPTARAEKKPASAGNSVMTDSVNYMHDREIKYTLYDLAKTPMLAVGGAIVEPLATGGEKGCCLSLPTYWKPGMKVRVAWGEADRKQIYPEKYTRDLEIPKYDKPADLYVVFYPGHDVEVVVSPAEPGHPDWRGRIKNTPWEQCLATHERKVCKAALPKQFDTSSQGFCNYLKEESPENMLLCDDAMAECMRDYEDEPFCKNILWGPRKK